MVIQALSAEGGVEYLRTQARNNPTAFLTLVGKVLPLQLANNDNQPLTIRWESQ
jgi:hypothetical protein